MPVQRTHNASDIEKRLKILKSQLYGQSHFMPQIPTSSIQHPTSNSDLTFLKKDLLKIAILVTLAIGIQLILYFSQLPSKIKLF